MLTTRACRREGPLSRGRHRRGSHRTRSTRCPRFPRPWAKLLHPGEVTDDESPANVEFTIFTGQELLRDQYRMLHGRMTDVVGFELPITDEAIEELLEAAGSDYTPGRELPATSVPGAIHAAVVESLPEDAESRYFEADSGRGASGYAVALELAGYVADVGGAGTALWVSALGVRRLYERLRMVMDQRPLVSMGTAVYLAAADLSERIGTSDFDLHGSGDARTGSPDASYAGDDHFFVIFRRDRVLYSYLVDARGRVHLLDVTNLTHNPSVAGLTSMRRSPSTTNAMRHSREPCCR